MSSFARCNTFLVVGALSLYFCTFVALHNSKTFSVAYFLLFDDRRNPPPTPAATTAATGTNNDTTAQNQVDLVKSMTPDERKEYVTNFLKTQVRYANLLIFTSYRLVLLFVRCLGKLTHQPCSHVPIYFRNLWKIKNMLMLRRHLVVFVSPNRRRGI